jgi:hypothetical protein
MPQPDNTIAKDITMAKNLKFFIVVCLINYHSSHQRRRKVTILSSNKVQKTRNIDITFYQWPYFIPLSTFFSVFLGAVANFRVLFKQIMSQHLA